MFEESGHTTPHQGDFEEDFYDGISAMSDSSAESDSPLSPLSPPWKPPEHGLAKSPWNDPPSPNFSWSPCLGSEDIGDVSIPVSNEITSFSSDQVPYLLGVDLPRPKLVPLHIPWSSHQHIPMHQLDEHPPSSPHRSALSLADMDIDDPPELRAPHLSLSGLPELEHEKALPRIPPSSPSRRSCSSLPDDTDSLPSSPGPSLLSLPGADTDDDLLPGESAFVPLTSSQGVPFVPSQPLLFIHDPRDVPLPRSPSPEDFHLCLSVHDMDGDPELAQLFELRKRSLAAVQGPPDGPECTDTYTRKSKKKRERERSAEVGALLRLKLGDKLGMDVNEGKSPERRKKGVIGSISQLVAQMVFRRHEASRPLTKRKPMLSAQEYVHSPLSTYNAVDS
ncbi:hypothetical protein F4604DRAFT_1786168 [Suillus subluteus]|nr:hypothetical protein F4604DRAFT_1786168 [Suillus subluteus]